MLRVFTGSLFILVLASAASAADGNRLAYLDGPLDPYYPHRDFPKLITPQWVGEEGVECVVTLAIDDMRESAKYEAFLRPILDRLKQIDGRAPVSIMSCRVDPADPQLQAWLKEGLSIEVHTYDHPCPCLQDGGLVKAKETYDKCVDLMNQIPGNKPVAFRMPCCDSKNTHSPRFWAEVFNKTTEKGNFLQIDSSVFNIITSRDKDLPKEIAQLPSGEDRFRRYVPFTNFVNTIEDYPYPYVIGGMCWEFPCVVPSDWSAQHVQQPNNPDTVRDWKLALDACVLKQGTFNLVFHPHGWIRSDQIVELIDHAVSKHGKKVKFLNFRECAERLNANVLGDMPLSHLSDNDPLKVDKPSAKDDLPKYARSFARPVLADINHDGFMDVRYDVNLMKLRARDWLPDRKLWREKTAKAEEHLELAQLAIEDSILHNRWYVDIDGDGHDERVFANNGVNIEVTVPATSNPEDRADERKLPFSIPATVAYYGGHFDSGLRLVDVNGDGKLDCLFSNDERYSLHLFKDMKEGWSIKVIDGVRGREEGNVGPVIPPFVRADRTNNGAWFHSSALWLMNEDTWRLPDNVFKLTFAEMLGKKGPGAGGQEPVKAQGALLDKPAVAPNASRTQYSVLSTKKPAEQSASPETPKIDMPPPLSPEDSLKVLHVRPGMKVELVAAEPLIVDPVAFDWGPDGRLWVVEMRDYPNGITWKKEGDKFGDPGGRVKVLTDENGDGNYDKAALFLDEIPFPTGVKVWRKGILVTAAPEIFYAEDTNGDDKADVRKTLYRGFGEGNQQHRVNGLRWGLDGWLYVGNGDSGGVIKALAGVQSGQLAPRVADPPKDGPPGAGNSRSELPTTTDVNVNGRDLRIRPDTGEIEAVSGQTQFGRERDDWGNWFGGNNSDPMWHYTLDDHYLRRNPHFAPPPTKKQVSVSPGAAPVFPRSKTLKRFNDENKANRFTSACSPMIYRDELLGPEFVGNSFVCEPVHNLVHREIVTPVGTTFTSRRADDEQTSEFLASEDSWFRPSMVRTGPDGALWVSDMYRFVIEHPKWIPADFQKQLDLRAGDDRGRIYRIYPENTKPRSIVRLDKFDTAGLVAALDSPNGTQRDLAHQMLILRGDDKAIEVQLRLAMAATSEKPYQRLHMICLTDELGRLPDAALASAISDAHPAVRRHAVRLAGPRLAKSPELTAEVLKLAGDADPQVRMQVAYSLGACDDPKTVEKLAELLTSSQADAYLSAACLSSLTKQNVGPVLAFVLSSETPTGSRGQVAEKLLAVAAAMGDDKAVGTALASILKPNADGGFDLWQSKALAATAEVLARRKLPISQVLDETGRKQLAEFLNDARELVGVEAGIDNTDWLPLAVAAVPLLARGLDDQDASDRKLLASLLKPQTPAELQSAAVAALARTANQEVPQFYLAAWAAHTPALRWQILDALLSRDGWSQELLAAIEKGKIPATQIDARRRQQLVTSKTDAIRKRAENVLATSGNTNRHQIVEQYLKAASPQDAEAARGKAVFAKRCANCHRLEGVGQTVGSDLAALNNRSRDVLLIAILDPNRAVEDRYLDYSVRLTDGRTVTGLLREETGTSITLAAAEGKSATILRSEIEALKSSGKSLMPEGVEKDVTPAEMADLVAYLQSHSPPPKQLAGNQPEVVRPFVDGSIRLLATNARVYGPNVVLEEKYRNLGWWGSAEDYASWSFDGGEAGQYRVVLDYACENGSAGNRVLVTVGGQTLGWRVEGTGTWDDYRGKDLGVVTLPAGPGELIVRSDGPIKAALLDLRGVRLSPVK